MYAVFCYHPYLVSMLFADLLSLHLVTFLMFFVLVVSIDLVALCVLLDGLASSWSNQLTH